MLCTLKLLGIDWLDCCAHKLQLCVKSAIHNQPILVTIISKAHKIIGFFHSSSVGQAALRFLKENLSQSLQLMWKRALTALLTYWNGFKKIMVL